MTLPKSPVRWGLVSMLAACFCIVLITFASSNRIVDSLISRTDFLPPSGLCSDTQQDGVSSGRKQEGLRCGENLLLPKWVTEGPGTFAREMEKGSTGLTDKVDKNHKFHYMYQPYLARLIRSKTACSVPEAERKVRMLEVGLGCHPSGGIKRKTPGGSALGWAHLFRDVPLDFEYHVMEFDEKCALKWAADHKDIAHVHTGDAASEQDLKRLVEEAGGEDFDIIIDDGSHINWHMIRTMEVMIHHVKMGGAYVVEDIWSSCRNWKANVGTHLGHGTGGSADCMTVKGGGGNTTETFFARIVNLQKQMLLKKDPIPSVNHIDFHGQAVLLEKALL